eukprot:GAHX01001130.1.p1 GENE.GAHX01001130.1~~GAHX01001130.1.p1  ORF type:complete len:230 (+),score=31.37 GAHX01001130.1:48-737(+)
MKFFLYTVLVHLLFDDSLLYKTIYLPDEYIAHYPSHILETYCSKKSHCDTARDVYIDPENFIHDPFVDLFDDEIEHKKSHFLQSTENFHEKVLSLICKRNGRYLGTQTLGSRRNRDYNPFPKLRTTQNEIKWKIKQTRFRGYNIGIEERRVGMYIEDDGIKLTANTSGSDFHHSWVFIEYNKQKKEYFITDPNHEYMIKCAKNTDNVYVSKYSLAGVEEDSWIIEKEEE